MKKLERLLICVDAALEAVSECVADEVVMMESNAWRNLLKAKEQYDADAKKPRRTKRSKP